MKLVAIILLLAIPSWAQQVVSVVPVVRGAVLQTDGGVTEIGAGAFFTTEEVLRMGGDHAQLRGENEHLREHAADVPYKWVAGAAAVGVAIGTVLGFFTARAVPR